MMAMVRSGERMKRSVDVQLHRIYVGDGIKSVAAW
jgi:hypothetical protein